MRALILAILLSVSGFAALAASPQCGGTADFYASLVTTYGETRAWGGLTPRGTVAELWINLATGTWTLLESAGGVTCIITHGEGVMPQGEAL